MAMKTFRKSRWVSFGLAILFGAMLIAPGNVLAEDTVNLGTASNYAVLAGSTITNTGDTTIGGDAGGNIGVSPGTAITGFPPGVISNGTAHSADAETLQAQADLTIAYNDAASRPSDANLSGSDLGGMTLTTGVYTFNDSAQLTGTLTLDAQGDPDAAFIFQIGSTLTTASGSSVELINGARYCRVFWQVGSSATLGTDTDFIGHIFALTSITANTGASVQGQLLARNGAVTLDNNVINNGFCAAITPTPTPTTEPTPTTAPTIAPTAEPTPTLAPTVAPTSTLTPTPTTAAVPTPTGSDTPKTGETDQFGTLGLALVLLGIAGFIGFYLSRKRVK